MWVTASLPRRVPRSSSPARRDHTRPRRCRSSPGACARAARRALRAQRPHERRRHQHPHHSNARHPLRVPGHSRSVLGPARRSADRGAGDGQARRLCRGASGCSRTCTPSAARPRCATSTSRARRSFAMTSPTEPGSTANVIGVGLIGGSIGMALRARGWKVFGSDADETMVAKALELGAVDAIGLDPDAAITFVATPVRSITEAARHALAAGCRVVTDAGSVKGPVVEADRRRPVRRRSSDGGIGAGGRRGRGRRAVRGRGLGAHSDERHRGQRVHAGGRGGLVVRGRSGRPASRAPRRARRRRLARASPHRGDADGCRGDSRRGARSVAATCSRRLPRHDPHRLGPSRDLARHLS